LEYWFTQLNSKDSIKLSSLYEDKSNTEQSAGLCYLQLGKCVEADDHFDKSISYAKRVVRDEKATERLYDALMHKASALYNQSKFSEGKDVCQEVYNLMAEAYYPDHPKVLSAANFLINTLIALEEYYDAER
jgi:tetratricopeptide (TPR) repeat protein